MLLRAYRFTDKLGIVLLKLSTALAYALLAGLGDVLGVVAYVLRGVFAALALVAGLLVRIFGGLLKGLFAVLRRVGAVGLFLLNLVNRLLGGAAGSVTTGAGSAMARRAARAEMEAGLAEDPLRAQNRVLSGVTVVLLAALIGVILWATNPTRTSTNAPPPAVLNLNAAAATAPAATAPTLPTLIPTATPIPSILQARGTLAYVVRENGQDDIWAVGVGDRTPLRLTNNIEDDRDPAWSPDGRRLAYASRQDGNWEIYIYDVFSGATTRMTYDLSFQGAPRWSPDGQWLVYESYQGNNLDVYVMRADGSEINRLTDHPAPDFSPAWSPDGRRIAFVSWRDSSQDVHLFSLDDPRDAASINLSNTPQRDEDYPVWSPDGKLLAYSALDEGIEKVFVKPADDPASVAQALGRGRAPTWSPDGASLVVAVDSIDTTQLVAIPFAGTGFATLVVPVAQGATSPDWSPGPLPQPLVNAGGLPSGSTQPLFIEQEQATNTDPPFKLNSLIAVEAPVSALSDRVNDSFNALRDQVLNEAGWDFLGRLEDAFWPIDRLPQPGEERRNWHMTGRAFSINRNAIVGFPAPIEVLREDIGIETEWRILVRVAEEAQDGQLGEPLRRMPWDFLSRNEGDVDAYNEGGRLRREVPSGYYVDLTRLARDFGWERVASRSDWRANFNSTNYWMFVKPGGLAWYDAMREVYTEGQLGGFTSGNTTAPEAAEPEAVPTAAVPETATPAATPALLPPPPTVESGGDSQ